MTTYRRKELQSAAREQPHAMPNLFCGVVPGDRYCDACGGALSSICEECMSPNRPGARFCGACGSSIGTAGASSSAFCKRGGRAFGYKEACDNSLFSLRGSTSLIERLDPEAALFRLEPAEDYVGCGSPIWRHRGPLPRDGAMALFGVPNATEDRRPQAHVSAARDHLDDIAALNEQQISSRIGIASGEVVVRSTGRDDSDYDVAGVAANLCGTSRAGGGPRVHSDLPETAWLARGAINAAQVEPAISKGLSTGEGRAAASGDSPAILEMRASASKLTPFVGREQEKSDPWKATLRELQRGRG